MTTLEEAKAKFFEEAKRQGSRCPCCERYGKIYRRKLHSSMAAVLILMYRNRNRGFMHVATLINATSDPTIAAAIRGDFAKLRYWGLIEEGFTATKDKKYSGLWRITPTGCDFVENKVKVYKAIWIYNTNCLGHATEEQIDIHDALGNKFSYRELMA